MFTGVLAQTIWQSSALGLISLIADREEDFSQEIFVSPVSRYAIVAGKIIGESLVALPTGLGIVVIGLLIGVPLSPLVLLALVPVSLVIADLRRRVRPARPVATLRASGRRNQIFPFVLLPQFFLAGVFNPIHDLPLPLAILSALSPMRYAVELMRNVFYGLQPSVPAPAITPRRSRRRDRRLVRSSSSSPAPRSSSARSGTASVATEVSRAVSRRP